MTIALLAGVRRPGEQHRPARRAGRDRPAARCHRGRRPTRLRRTRSGRARSSAAACRSPRACSRSGTGWCCSPAWRCSVDVAVRRIARGAGRGDRRAAAELWTRLRGRARSRPTTEYMERLKSRKAAGRRAARAATRRRRFEAVPTQPLAAPRRARRAESAATSRPAPTASRAPAWPRAPKAEAEPTTRAGCSRPRRRSGKNATRTSQGDPIRYRTFTHRERRDSDVSTERIRWQAAGRGIPPRLRAGPRPRSAR